MIFSIMSCGINTFVKLYNEIEMKIRVRNN